MSTEFRPFPAGVDPRRYRLCPRCGRWKRADATRFRADASRAGGLSPLCRLCLDRADARRDAIRREARAERRARPGAQTRFAIRRDR